MAIVSYNDLKFKNKFGQLWKDSFSEFVKSDCVNIDEFGSVLLSQKDQDEIKMLKKSSNLNTTFFKNFMIEEVVKYISGSKSITNLNFSNRIENLLQNEKIWKKIGGMKDLVFKVSLFFRVKLNL